jgi:hypothetical protein
LFDDFFHRVETERFLLLRRKFGVECRELIETTWGNETGRKLIDVRDEMLFELELQILKTII